MTTDNPGVYQPPPAPVAQEPPAPRPRKLAGELREPSLVGYMVVSTASGDPIPRPQNGIWRTVGPCKSYVAYCEGMAERDQLQRGWIPQQYRIVEVRELGESA